MVYLLLSVLCSVLLGFIFKVFPKYGVNTLQAIVVNYFICIASATLHKGHFPVQAADMHEAWFPFGVMLGFVFITGFNGAAITAQYFGVTISQIMQRMSILLTVPYVIFAYGESVSIWKVLGFFAAIFAIILVNWPEKTEEKVHKNYSKWLMAIPLITWFLASIIEIVFVKIQTEKMIAFGNNSFISTVFGTAGILGSSYLLFLYLRGKTELNWASVWGGLILGIPNYGSMYFALQALSSGLEGSFFYPVNNVGIILITVLGGFLFFHEKYTRLNLVGLVCAILAILFMAV